MSELSFDSYVVATCHDNQEFMGTDEWIETLKVFQLIFTTEGGKEKKHVERHGLGDGGPGGGWARPAGGSVQYSLLQRPELAVYCCFWSSQQHQILLNRTLIPTTTVFRLAAVTLAVM